LNESVPITSNIFIFSTVKFTWRSVSYPQTVSSRALRCVIVQGSTNDGSVHQLGQW